MPEVVTELDIHASGIHNQKTGAGVLALPNALSYLGWVAGPLIIILFYCISLLTSLLLVDVYEVDGVEHGRYYVAVKNILGHGSAIGVSIFQCTNIFLVGITYTISAATAMKSIANIACGWNGISQDDCFNSSWKMTLFFGAAQIFLSQVQSLEEAWWVSAIGVFTSLFYCCTALALGLKYAGARLGSVGGRSASDAGKAFGILSSLGAIAFAYNFSVILLEIQDTLRQPPKARNTMRGASIISITSSFAFYFTVAVANYSAFGNDVPGFIFDAYPGPDWLLLVGQLCIMVHMLSAYQVFGQPMFDTIESAIALWMWKRAKLQPDAESHGKVEMEEFPKSLKIGDQALAMDPVQPSDDAKGSSDGQTTSDAKGDGQAAGDAHGAHSTLHRLSAKFGEELQRLSANPPIHRLGSPLSHHANGKLCLWQRLITRTIYVLATTVIACIMPFFSDMAGLVGAVTFFPLAVYFPIHCWRMVYKPKGPFNYLLWVIEISMTFVCIAATIASMRNIINNWSSYKLFD